MADRINEEFIFPFEFRTPLTIIQEAKKEGVALIQGTLLAEGVSRNGNLYTIEEMERIAKQAEGTPIYYGTMTKIDPNTGMIIRNAHANIPENKVGRIIKAWLDKKARKIRFIAEVVNTPKFPDIIKKIKSGWGISIGGVATKAKYVMDKIGRILLKVLGLKLNHVQLLSPSTLRGMQSAKVEKVQIHETMIMVCDPVTGVCQLKPKPNYECTKKSETEPEPDININITIKDSV